MTRTVDLDKLRRSLAQLRRGELLIVAQRAAEMLPEGALPSLLGGLFELQSGAALAHGPAALLEEVQKFCAEGIDGKFYLSFDVNARNCSEQSKGTDTFIAEFDRLIAKCVRAAETGPCQTVGQAFEALFSLLRAIDEGNDDVLFFADDGGAWSVGVDWNKALPGYFMCLAQTATARHYVHCVDRVIADFSEHDRGRHMAQAWTAANTEQRELLRDPP